MAFASLLAGFIAGLCAAALAYAMTRNRSTALWGAAGAALPDIPALILLPFGIQQTPSFFLFSHTAGIFLFPVALVLADLLLMELRILRFLKPFSFILPSGIKTALRFEALVEKLMKYRLIPYPVRLKTVYFAAASGGVIHSALELLVLPVLKPF